MDNDKSVFCTSLFCTSTVFT